MVLIQEASACLFKSWHVPVRGVPPSMLFYLVDVAAECESSDNHFFFSHKDMKMDIDPS
jgi:hypothetical protein